MRVIRPFSTERLTAVFTSPPMSMRPPGDPLSQTALASKFAERAAPIRKRATRTAPAIGHDNDVGREDVEEALQVAVSDGGEESVHSFLLLRRADRHSRAPSRDVV